VYGLAPPERYAKFAGCEQPAMSGDHLAVAVDQDRDNKAENPDAVGDLADLLLAMTPRVRRVGR
jgi:hypothetical protein